MSPYKVLPMSDYTSLYPRRGRIRRKSAPINAGLPAGDYLRYRHCLCFPKTYILYQNGLFENGWSKGRFDVARLFMHQKCTDDKRLTKEMRGMKQFCGWHRNCCCRGMGANVNSSSGNESPAVQLRQIEQQVMSVS